MIEPTETERRRRSTRSWMRCGRSRARPPGAGRCDGGAARPTGKRKDEVGGGEAGDCEVRIRRRLDLSDLPEGEAVLKRRRGRSRCCARIVHRWGGSPDADWYPWLRDELSDEPLFEEVAIPALPEALDRPDLGDVGSGGREVARRRSGRAGRDRGRGPQRGCQAAVRASATLRGERVAGVLLVAPGSVAEDEQMSTSALWEESAFDERSARRAAGWPFPGLRRRSVHASTGRRTATRGGSAWGRSCPGAGRKALRGRRGAAIRARSILARAPAESQPACPGPVGQGGCSTRYTCVPRVCRAVRLRVSRGSGPVVRRAPINLGALGARRRRGCFGSLARCASIASSFSTNVERVALGPRLQGAREAEPVEIERPTEGRSLQRGPGARAGTRGRRADRLRLDAHPRVPRGALS